MEKALAALVQVGRYLSTERYHFVTVTPETHRRVLEREGGGERIANSLRDVFGWNKPFTPDTLPATLLQLLVEADACGQDGELLRAKVRFSSLGSGLYVHSAFPTTDTHSVFFGPDTYRYCALLERCAANAQRVVDVGCGSGAGGISLARVCRSVVLSDVNPLALAYARVNAALAGVPAEVVHSDVLAGVQGDVDLVVANPPYLLDEAERVYRNGGGEYGEGLAVRIVREAIAKLQPRGRFIVYTGAAVVAGVDQFYKAVEPALAEANVQYQYTEIDPDVFGEELSLPAYRDVERLAAVALCGRMP